MALLNFADVQVNSYDPVENGVYEVTCSKLEEKLSSTRSEMLAVEWTITGPKNAGRKLFDNLVITNNTRWKIKSVLEAIGSTLGNKNNISTDLIVKAIRNSTCRIDVGTEPDRNGNPRNKCNRYLPLKPSAKEAPTPEVESDLPF